LRKYYKTHHNPKWIFPALGRNGGKNTQYAKDHVSDSGVQGVLRSTLNTSEHPDLSACDHTGSS
jgi:integrase/recombinase XerD